MPENNYSIECQVENKLIIVSHYQYYSAAELRCYIEELTRHLKTGKYQRLLADYSGLTTVELSFMDKVKIIASRSKEIALLARDMKQATVTINEFQKNVAQQARTIGSAQSGINSIINVRYFNDYDTALTWLLQD